MSSAGRRRSKRRDPIFPRRGGRTDSIPPLPIEVGTVTTVPCARRKPRPSGGLHTRHGDARIRRCCAAACALALCRATASASAELAPDCATPCSCRAGRGWRVRAPLLDGHGQPNNALRRDRLLGSVHGRSAPFPCAVGPPGWPPPSSPRSARAWPARGGRWSSHPAPGTAATAGAPPPSPGCPSCFPAQS